MTAVEIQKLLDTILLFSISFCRLAPRTSVRNLENSSRELPI